MPRTTLDIDATVLADLKKRRRAEGKTLGQLASELLADALAETSEGHHAAPFVWTTQAMRARVDLEDKDAVYSVLDQP